MTDVDYQPGDEFDWDQSDDSQHCKHGTFIGSWWGPDLMCWFCEEGVSDQEYAEYRQHQAEQRQRTSNYHEALDQIVNAFLTFRNRPGDPIKDWLLPILGEAADYAKEA